jgi:hypothetical protein
VAKAFVPSRIGQGSQGREFAPHRFVEGQPPEAIGQFGLWFGRPKRRVFRPQPAPEIFGMPLFEPIVNDRCVSPECKRL